MPFMGFMNFVPAISSLRILPLCIKRYPLLVHICLYLALSISWGVRNRLGRMTRPRPVSGVLNTVALVT